MLVRTGFVVVLVLVNVRGFRPVLARTWHAVWMQLLVQCCYWSNDPAWRVWMTAKDGAVARLSCCTSLLYGTTDEWPAQILIAATDLMLQKSIMENG
jgi:hypothetical protein